MSKRIKAGGVMNSKTLKALQASIRHWERMRDGKRRKMRDDAAGTMELEMPIGQHCGLCRATEDCDDCPVASYGSACENTPFYEAEFAFHQAGPNSDEFKLEANKEVEFLKSLLPENQR